MAAKKFPINWPTINIRFFDSFKDGYKTIRDAFRNLNDLRKNVSEVGNNHADLIDNLGNLLHVRDQKAQNTNGGTFTSGSWQTRDLNTVVTNNIIGTSLASNQITLPAGTYYCNWSAPAVISLSSDNHQTRLQDITGAAVLILGTSEGPGKDVQVRSFGSGNFVLTVESVLELQHQITTTLTTNGFGKRANFAAEVYSEIFIWKIK